MAGPATPDAMITARGLRKSFVTLVFARELRKWGSPSVAVPGYDVRVLDGLDTAVAASDAIVILPAMAGGA